MLGLLHDDLTLEVIANVSAEPTAGFSSAARITGSVIGVIHTHPAGLAWPSFVDQAQQIASGVRWVIIPKGGEAFGWGGDTHHSLTLRSFRWGVTDCWGLVRDAGAAMFDYRLGNYARDWQFWRKRPLFETRVHGEGFEKVSEDLAEAAEGDVVLMRLHSKVWNHCGLVLEDSMLFHHPSGTKPYDPTMPPRLEPLDRYSRIPCGVFRRA